MRRTLAYGPPYGALNVLLKMGISIKIHVLFSLFSIRNWKIGKVIKAQAFPKFRNHPLLDYVFTMHFRSCADVLYT